MASGWGKSWTSISAFKFDNDGTTVKITGSALGQNNSTSAYKATNASLFYYNGGFYGTSASAVAAFDAGNPAIASFSVWKNSGVTVVSGIKLTDAASSYTFSIEGTSVSMWLSHANDKVVLDANATITSASIGQGGSDTFTFEGTTDKKSYIGFKTGASIASGDVTFKTSDGANVLKLGNGTSIGTSSSVINVKGAALTLDLDNKSLLVGSSNGKVNLEVEGTGTNIKTWEINDGSFNLTKGSTSISSLVATGGKFTLGTATIAKGSTLTNLTTASSVKLEVAKNGSFDIKGFEVGSLPSGQTEFAIDNKYSTIKSAIAVKSAANNIKETLSSVTGAQTSLDITSIASGKYFIAQATTNTNAVSLSGGTGLVLDGAGGAGVSVTASEEGVTDWVVDDMSGTVVISTGDGNDKLTLGAKSATKGSVSLGAGVDTIALSTAGRPSSTNIVSISAGAGEDIFDLSKSDQIATAKGFYVSDFGSGLSKNSPVQDSLGYDKIFVGNVDLGSLTNYTVQAAKADVNKNVLVINGVEFDVTGNEKGFVQIGTGSSIANAKWTTYNMTDAGLVTVESAGADIESLTAGESYKAVDSLETAFASSVKGAESNLSIGNTESVASAINESLAAAGADANKYLNIASQTVDGTIDMGDNGNNYIMFEKGSKADVDINKGTKTGTVAITNSNVDLSDVSIKGFNSTKDTLVADVNLDQYLTSSVTTGFAGTDGSYGTDVVAANGNLAATTVSGGLYKTKFREAVIQNDSIVAANNEIAVVTGAKEGAKGNFGAEKTGVFAILDNNGDAADTVTGSANKDVFVLGKGDSVNGGEGDDLIAMKGKDATVVLASGNAGNDTVIGLAEGVGTLKLANNKSIDSLSVAFNGDGGFTLATDSVASSQFVNTVAGENAVAGVFNTKIADKNDTYNAMLINTNADDSIVLDAAAVKDTNLFIGAKDGTALVDFSNTDKTLIHLASSDPDDTTTYSNIRYVKASNKGGSQLYGGGNAASTLVAGGANDSLWGGLESQKDSLVSAVGETTFFGSTKDSGADTIANFQFGTGAGADVLILMDGTDNSTFKVSNDAVVVGSSDKDNLTIQNEGHDGVVDIQFRLGTESTIVSAARADTGDGTIDFDNDIAWYLGQGEKTTLDLGKGAVTLGYQSGNGSINVGTLDGRNTAAGSIINGGMENANVVYASENGASSISGAFDGNWAESYDDTLVGGGNGETMFYVGKDMGNDVINNLTDGDKIVFLGTKIGDITNDLKTLSGNSFNVEFGDSSKVVVNTATDVSNMKNVTIYFDDKQADWNGSGWNVHDKN